MANNHLRLNDLRRSDLPEGRYELTRSPVRIGRGPRCEIRLHFDGIADVQAILRRDGENWQIYPVGPAQGCLIAQKPLTDSVLLLPGTNFVIGHVRFELANSNTFPLRKSPLSEESKPLTQSQIPGIQPETLSPDHKTSTDLVEEMAATEIPAETSSNKPEFEPLGPEVTSRSLEPLVTKTNESIDIAQDLSSLHESSALQIETSSALQIETSLGFEPANMALTQMAESQMAGEHSPLRVNASENALFEQLMTKTPAVFQEPVSEPVNNVLKSTLLPSSNYDVSDLLSDSEVLRRSSKIPKLAPSSHNLDETFTPSVQQPLGSSIKDSSRKTNRASATTLKSLSAWADDFSRRYHSVSLPTTATAISPNLASILDQNEFQPLSATPVNARGTNSHLLESAWPDQQSLLFADQKQISFAQPFSPINECSTPLTHIHHELIEPQSAINETEVEATVASTFQSEILLADGSPEHANSPDPQVACCHGEELIQSNESKTCSGMDSAPLQAVHINPDPVSIQASDSILIKTLSETVSVELENSTNSEEELVVTPVFRDPESFQLASIESVGNDDEQQEHETIQATEIDQMNDSLGVSDFIESRINSQVVNPDTESIALEGMPYAPHFLQPRNAALDFEDWLDSVGSILDSVSRETNEPEVVPQQIPEHDAINPPIELESESVEILLNTTCDDSVSVEMSHRLIEGKIIDQDDNVQSKPFETEPISEVQPAALAEIVSGSLQNNDDSEKPVEGQWPSVGDILKWSATRTGTPPFQQSSNHEMTKSQPETLEPDQFLRINLPVAMFMGVFLAFGSIGLLGFAWKMSVQDNLTQSVISSVLSASKAGQAPRLPAKSLESLSQHQPWWQITSDQIWWRATFLKMRETGGLVVTQPSEVLAERALQNNPLLPAGRLWKASSSEVELNNPDLWGYLSRDVISMTMAADHFRRIGDDQLANQADRKALDLATSPEQLFRLRKVEFDSELGTERFLLPGQFQTLVIMKRLVKEPDPIKTIMSVLPDNKPVVWLTAAQLIRQNGLGDPSDLIKRVLDAVPDGQNGLLESQRLTMAIRAEALAMNQQTPEAIEVYKKLTQQSPASDWARSWYFNLGELNSRNQKLDEALVSWRKARGEDPNHQVDRHAIQATRSFASSVSSPVIGNASTTIRAN